MQCSLVGVVGIEQIGYGIGVPISFHIREKDGVPQGKLPIKVVLALLGRSTDLQRTIVNTSAEATRIF